MDEPPWLKDAPPPDEAEAGVRQQIKPSSRHGISKIWVPALQNNLLIVVVALGVMLISRVGHFEHRDAIYLAAIFFVAGLGFAQLTRSVISLQKEWPFLAVIALPAILYLVLAGYVTGLKIPGGLEVEIKELLNEPPKTLEASQLDLFANVTSQTAMSQRDCDAVVNAVVMKERDSDQTTANLRPLLRCNRNIDYVVFVNPEYRFIGMVDAGYVNQILDPNIPNNTNPGQLDSRLQAGAGGYATIFGDLEFQDDWIDSSATIGQLLERMNGENLDAIALVDRHGRFDAVVELEEMLSQLMVRIGGFDEGVPTPTQPPTPTPTQPPAPTLTPPATLGAKRGPAPPTPDRHPRAAPTRPSLGS